jgi:hypothetical protein
VTGEGGNLKTRPLEVWLNNGDVETINALGEGLPLEDMEWPWPETAKS